MARLHLAFGRSIGAVVLLGGCDAAQQGGIEHGEAVALQRSAANQRADAAELIDAAPNARWAGTQRSCADQVGKRALADADDRQPPQAADVVVVGNRFDFDRIGGRPPVVVDFDEMRVGDNLNAAGGASPSAMDLASCGVDFVAFAAPLVVVRAADTFLGLGYRDVREPRRHFLVATSGEQVLSPGGSELAPGPAFGLEEDDLTLVFDPPVCAVGFDLLTPSADGMSFVEVTVLDHEGRVLHAGTIATRAVAASFGEQWPPPGTDFFGVVSGERNIAAVVIDERDGNAECPDSNIGLDTLRFAPAPVGTACDVDGDGLVDGRDLVVITEALGSARAWTPGAAGEAQSEVASPLWLAADLDRDGDVDAQDVAIWLSAGVP